MLTRKNTTPIKALAAGEQGSMNEGIFLVRTRKNTTAIEKRFDLETIQRGFASQETRALSLCSNRYICRYLGTDMEYRKTGYSSLFMEHCELGSLQSFTEKFERNRTLIPEAFLWKVLFEMSLAICYMQTGVDAEGDARAGKPLVRKDKKKRWEEIVHCDIKPANLFLTMHGEKSAYPTAVLGDFGCATFESDRRVKGAAKMPAFTLVFGPPEAPKYSDASDIYSLALSVHCAALLRPYPVQDYVRLHAEPLGNRRETGYSRTLSTLLKRMLNKRVEDRPDALYLPYLVYREMQAAKVELGALYPQQAARPLPEWAYG
jgi:serine/threonine protein kinase